MGKYVTGNHPLGFTYLYGPAKVYTNIASSTIMTKRYRKDSKPNVNEEIPDSGQ